MKLLDSLARRFGYAKVRRRSYDAGSTSRLFSSWAVQSLTSDAELKANLKSMRARSRDLARNNDYAKRILSLFKTNVIGAQGVTLQNKARKRRGGELDKPLNDQVEAMWREAGRAGGLNVDGHSTWVDTQRQILDAVTRDGECLIEKIEGPKARNRFGFAVRIIEPDLLDEALNQDKTSSGNRISLGVELDSQDRPVAYHLFEFHPGEYGSTIAAQARRRVLAKDIVHVYVKERPTQSRGVPWMHAAMTRLKMTGGYEEAEVVSARASSCKMAAIYTDTGTEAPYDEKDENGEKISDFESGLIWELSKNQKIELLDPKHPSGNFDPFMKAMLRGIAAGVGLSYHSVANDLADVNFSSIRSGSLEERDFYRTLQYWFQDHVCTPIFTPWLQAVLMLELIPGVGDAEEERVLAPSWGVRGWQWVDPLKDVTANLLAIKNGLKSRTMVVREMGYDLEEVFEQLQQEQQLAASYDLQLDSNVGTAEAIALKIIEREAA